MYRNGLQTALDRYRVARERVDGLRARLAHSHPDMRLPDHLEQRLAELGKQIEPVEQTVEAVVAAETALDEYEQLLEQAPLIWKRLRREERRRRHARALAAIKEGSFSRKVRIAIAVGGAAGVLAILHHVSLSVTCLGSDLCAKYGACSAEILGDRCLAKSDEDCINCRACKEDGWCSAKDGRCVATTDSDCERSDECHQYNRCVADNGHCVKGEP